MNWPICEPIGQFGSVQFSDVAVNAPLYVAFIAWTETKLISDRITQLEPYVASVSCLRRRHGNVSRDCKMPVSVIHNTALEGTWISGVGKGRGHIRPRPIVRTRQKHTPKLHQMWKFSQLILRTKIIKTVATRSHILKPQCTKLYFGWGRSAPNPAGELTAFPLAF